MKYYKTNRIILFLSLMPIILFSKMTFKERFTFLRRGAKTHLLLPEKSIKRIGCSFEEINKQRRLFGYDLGIEYQYGCGHRYHKTQHRAILYLHPWGIFGIPHKGSADLLRYYHVLPGDVIVFNFPDGGWRNKFPLSYSSFGQLSDILPAIYVLYYAYENFGLEAVDLFGYSRGGAVAINMIAVLYDKTGQYDNQLAYIGIDVNKRMKLLEIIQRGSVVLNCPLADTNATFNMYSTRIKDFLYRITQYQTDGLQAIESAQLLKGLKLNVLIHYQYNDRRVFNIKDAEFYVIFKQLNPETTYLVLGNDGGHVHTQRALASTIHVFYKKIGGAYDPLWMQKKGIDTTIELLQPDYNQAAKVIGDYYSLCEQIEKKVKTVKEKGRDLDLVLSAEA